MTNSLCSIRQNGQNCGNCKFIELDFYLIVGVNKAHRCIWNGDVIKPDAIKIDIQHRSMVYKNEGKNCPTWEERK